MSADWLETHALVDGELSAEQASELRAKLSENEEVRREAEAVTRLKDLVSEKCQPVHCEKTWQKCRSRFEELEKSKRVEGFVGRYAWGLCGAVALLLVGVASFNRANPSLDPSSAWVSSAGLGPLSSSSSPVTSLQSLSQRGKGPVQINTGDLNVLGGTSYREDGLPVAVFDVPGPDGISRCRVTIIGGEISMRGLRESGNGRFAGQFGRQPGLAWYDEGCTVMVVGPTDESNLEKIADEIDLK